MRPAENRSAPRRYTPARVRDAFRLGRGWKCEWTGGGGTTVGRWAVGTSATGAAGHRRRGDNTFAHATLSAHACEACATFRNALRQRTSGALHCATPLGCRKRTSAMRRFSTCYFVVPLPHTGQVGTNHPTDRTRAAMYNAHRSTHPHRLANTAPQRTQGKQQGEPGGDTRNSTAQGKVNE